MRDITNADSKYAVFFGSQKFLQGGGTRYFTVDYDGNTFIKDGKAYRYVAGSLHYFRVPHVYWEDRLVKMAAAGLDAIQTYTFLSTFPMKANNL